MPQKDMRIIEKPASDEGVLKPEKGTSALVGNGDETFRCGACKTRLLENLSHGDLYHSDPINAVLCPKCGKYNALPPDNHHHHHH